MCDLQSCVCRFYPHHYAPHISDVRNFSHMKIDFDLSRPFMPFEQLMAVLPAASKTLLPEPLQVRAGSGSSVSSGGGGAGLAGGLVGCGGRF